VIRIEKDIKKLYAYLKKVKRGGVFTIEKKKDSKVEFQELYVFPLGASDVLPTFIRFSEYDREYEDTLLGVFITKATNKRKSVPVEKTKKKSRKQSNSIKSPKHEEKKNSFIHEPPHSPPPNEIVVTPPQPITVQPTFLPNQFNNGIPNQVSNPMINNNNIPQFNDPRVLSGLQSLLSNPGALLNLGLDLNSLNNINVSNPNNLLNNLNFFGSLMNNNNINPNVNNMNMNLNNPGNMGGNRYRNYQ